jgi:hypothetical protein
VRARVHHLGLLVPVVICLIAVGAYVGIASAGSRTAAPVTKSNSAAPAVRPTASPTASVAPATASPAALAALNKLAISDAFVANYVRDDFGAGWKDPDHNGCDARNDVLNRDLTAQVYKPGTHDCVVLSGTLADPYTGTTISFVRGNVSSMAVQIDHIVPLGWAWQHGAATWTPEQRLVFANDPTNLLAVSGPANEAKSDKGPADWMPANVAYRCDYISKFEGSLVKYNFSVAKGDLAAIRSYLTSCTN